jgi:hypothetical protein
VRGRLSADDPGATSVFGVTRACPHSSPDPHGVPPLLDGLVDDAALFPPGHAGMAEAVGCYLCHAGGEHGRLLGSFLCPSSRLSELVSALGRLRPAHPVPLSLAVDTGMGGVPKAVSRIESHPDLLTLEKIEMPAPGDVDEMWLERVSEFVPEDVTRVVEPRRGGPGWLDGVRRVAEYGCVPKLRCGGTRKQNFPSIEDTADFLAVLSTAGTPFKATSGLYGPARGYAATVGTMHHGYLNVLVATARSLSDGDVRAALRCTDGASLAAEAAALSELAASEARGLFSSYGSTSVPEAVSELENLGLL